MGNDRNLLFGILALQADVINASQFTEACALWALRKETDLAEVLENQGWLDSTDRDDVERLVERKLRRFEGDVQASLAAVVDDNVRQSLLSLDDEQVNATLPHEVDPNAHILLTTLAHTPESRDRYTLTRIHAQGGIGRVWLARDASLGRQVALKELRPDRSPSKAVWARFVEEARITGQLEHPSIIPIYELAGSDKESPYYTMRFVKGRTLAAATREYHERLKAGTATTLELRELVNAFVGVANAIAYAHSRGVIHRDLKGSNVVLGDFGEVIVLDWGLAKVLGGEDAPTEESREWISTAEESGVDATMQGQAIGTPAYMSPEQAAGDVDSVNTLSDVYGLGAILYEILCGQPPFRGSDISALLQMVQHDPPQRPRQLCSAAPPQLEAICLKAIAKKQELRYSSAGELAKDVQRWFADEPVEAFPEPFSMRVSRWARRNRGLVASSAALLLTIAVALGVSTVLVSQQQAIAQANYEKAERQRKRAEENYQLALESVDRFFVRVTKDRLLDEPGMKPLQRDLLTSAKELFETIVEKRRDDSDARLEMASALFQLVRVTEELESTTKTREMAEEARKLFVEIVKERPDDLRARYGLAQVQATLGALYRKAGERIKAEAMFVECKKLLAKLRTEQPSEVKYGVAESGAFFRHGQIFYVAGELTSAEEEWNKAMQIAEELSRDHPNDESVLSNYSTCLSAAGAVAFMSGDLETARSKTEDSTDATRRLVKEFSSQSVLYRDLLANRLSTLGMVHQRLGNHDDGKKAAQEAIDTYVQLFKEHPHVWAFEYALARNHMSLGTLHYSAGDFEAALKSYQDSLVIRERQAREHPDMINMTFEWARNLQNVGVVYQELKRFSEAEKSYLKAVEITELKLNETSAPKHLRDLAGTLHSLTSFYTDTKQPERAEATAKRAIDLHQKLVDKHPQVSEYLRGLALSYGGQGFLQRRFGKLEDALASYLRQHELAAELIKASPQDTEVLQLQRNAEIDAATLMSWVGKHEEALPRWDRVLEIVDESEKTEFRLWRSISAAPSQGYAESVALAEQAAAEFADSGPTQFAAAAVLSYCSTLANTDEALQPEARKTRAAEYRDRAMKLLTRANELAADSDYQLDLSDLKRCPFFQPLMDRDEIKAILPSENP